MPRSHPESTLPVFPCGSAADLPTDWQPLVSTWTSGTAGGHVSVFFSAPYEERFIIFSLPLQNIHTFLSHSSQASPVQKHFITILLFLLLLTFFLLTICLNDSITLTSKVQSICLQMQEVLLSWLYRVQPHIFKSPSDRREDAALGEALAFVCTSYIRSQRFCLSWLAKNHQLHFHNHMWSHSAHIAEICDMSWL